MAENSMIEWTDHTFNPWVGCTKVSPACDHCYAETQMVRRKFVEWGPKAERRRTSEANWKQPLKWNREAERAGKRPKVFCASLADVFDNQVPEEWREDLWGLIAATPHLNWLLLTKRPQNIAEMLPIMWGSGWSHVWLGTTVENQEEADRRIPHLLAVPAAKRFLSYEPLLGPVDLDGWLPGGSSCGGCDDDHSGGRRRCSRDDTPRAEQCPENRSVWTDDPVDPQRVAVNWVIAGGESGPGARPMHPDWARSLRDQCQAAGVPFFLKQWGEWYPCEWENAGDGTGTEIIFDDDRLNAIKRRWQLYSVSGQPIARVGKKVAGALLDGREWREFPA